MNTVTHMIVASATLSKTDSPIRNRWVIGGAILPDLSIYILSAWAVATGRMNETLWQVTYWQEPWQTLGAISNSVPLAILLLCVGLQRNWTPLTVMAGAMLIHAGLDLPLHADDAHRHFWPISDWRFHSTISYWDSDYHGLWGGLFDCACMFAGIAVLWLRFKALWVRILLLGLAALGAAFAGFIIFMAS